MFLSDEARAAIEEDKADPLGPVPTTSGRLALFHRRLRDLAATDAPVYFSGGADVGQSFYVRRIHERSGRQGLLLEVKGDDLCEGDGVARLFGRAQGRFGGSVDGGMLERARGGTVVIHDLHSVPPDIQRKLIEPVALRRYRPEGARKDRPAAVRFIFTTRSMPSIPGGITPGVDQTLGFALGDPLRLPSLVNRREDLAALAFHYLGPDRRLSRDVLRSLCLHSWPGNLAP